MYPRARRRAEPYDRGVPSWIARVAINAGTLVFAQDPSGNVVGIIEFA